jgi:hypothetical protein
MIKVKGIYEGTHVRLLEPVVLAPDTPVEVLIPEDAAEQRQEQTFLRRLVEEGLLAPTGLIPSPREEEPFELVPIQGAPLSQTIIEERR